MAEKTIVLVTGGNTGIGYEVVKALYASTTPHIVIMGSRSLDKAQAAIKTLQSEVTDSESEVAPAQIDIEDDTSIENLKKEIETRYGKLDVLVNNAGASFDIPVRSDTPTADVREIWGRSYTVNVTSTQVLTHALVPLLLKSTQTPRILFITSGLSSLEVMSSDEGPAHLGVLPKGWPKSPYFAQIAYRSSKTALNMMMVEWQRVLREDGVKVFAISPGFLATSLGGIGSETLKKMGARDPSEGGTLIRDVVEGKNDEHVGKVVRAGGVQPW